MINLNYKNTKYSDKHLTNNHFGLSRLWLPISASLLLTAVACGGGDSVPLVETPSAQDTGLPQTDPSKTTFTNVTANSGLNRNFVIVDESSTSDPAKMGGGLAAADFDNDEDIDLYVVGGDAEANALYRNIGNNTFVDVAEALGVGVSLLGSGPAFADIDGDDDLDLFVGAIEGDDSILFIQDNGRFENFTSLSGIAITADNTFSASFSDYDLDGDIDLFVSHWGNAPAPDTQNLWQNNGDGTFVSASISSGIADQIIGAEGVLAGLFDYSFASVFSDIDRDGDPDMLLASDFKTSKVFVNNGDGTFTNTTDLDVIIDRNGMGNSVGDYDNDGDMDWLVTSIFDDPDRMDANYGNRLYRNLGDGTFEDVTDEAGIANGGWAWASCMEDFDNDGDLDIVHVNGWKRADPTTGGTTGEFEDELVRYFESQGDGTFEEKAMAAGLTDAGQGRGLVCFDSDRDGDLDLVLTNNDGEGGIQFYRNDLDSDDRYLVLKLTMDGLNTSAIGSFIEVTDGTNTWIREIRIGNNFVSQSPAEAHFGVAGATSVDITINWPDGTQSSMTDVMTNQFLTVAQP